MSLDTLKTGSTVNKNQHGFKKSERECFPDPQNGFELVAGLLRSKQQGLLTINERYLYLLLADYVGDSELSCFPAVSTLASTMGITDRAMRRLLHSLRDKGFMAIKKRDNNGKVQSNIYTLVPASKVVGVTLGSGVGVTDGSLVPLTGGSAKETSGKETKAKENTPQTPLSGGIGVRGNTLMFEVCSAIQDVCSADKQLSAKTITKRAIQLIDAGYDAAKVYALADYILTECRSDYKGPLRPQHLWNHSLDDRVELYVQNTQIETA